MSFKIDLHNHTIISQHAYSTLEEIIRQAEIKELQCIAITDHGPAAPDGPFRYYFSNLKVIPKEINGIRILKGAEVNIINEGGEVDLDFDDIKKLDIVLAGFHKLTGYGESSFEKNTNALVKLIESDKVDILAHLGNPAFPFDMDQVLKKAKEHMTAIEFNNSSGRVSRKGSEDNCDFLMKKAKELGIYISLGSDSHISYDVGNLSAVTELVNKHNYPRELILNSNLKQLTDVLTERRNKFWKQQ